MSELDRELLAKIGLTPTKAAGLMKITRQAVSKGVTSPKHYFSPETLGKLSRGVAKDLPLKKEPLENAIAEMFDRLSERLAGGGAARNLAAAVAQAERLWLMLPRFVESSAEQPDAYDALFAAIAERTPSTRLRDHNQPRLEIVAYCDRNRVAIERRFAPEWFSQRRLLVIECATLERMSPMIVIDPHKRDEHLSFGLVQKGFEPMAPGAAAAQVASFGSYLSDKLHDQNSDGPPVDVQLSDVATLAKTGIRKL